MSRDMMYNSPAYQILEKYIIEKLDFKPIKIQHYGIVEEIGDQFEDKGILKFPVKISIGSHSRVYNCQRWTTTIFRQYIGEKIPMKKQDYGNKTNVNIDFNKLRLMFNQKKKFDEMN